MPWSLRWRPSLDLTSTSMLPFYQLPLPPHLFLPISSCFGLKLEREFSSSGLSLPTPQQILFVLLSKYVQNSTFPHPSMAAILVYSSSSLALIITFSVMVSLLSSLSTDDYDSTGQSNFSKTCPSFSVMSLIVSLSSVGFAISFRAKYRPLPVAEGLLLI